MFGNRSGRPKGMKSAGASPKGHGRPVRPTTAGGPQTTFRTEKSREATPEFVQLGWTIGKRRRRQRGMKLTSATPKGHGRPARPMTAGGCHMPFLY